MRKAFFPTLFLAMGLMANAQAADIGACPKVSEIKSEPYTDANLPAGHNEGFKYQASQGGHKWTGETMSTADDFLSAEYQLKASAISADGNTCEYGGKTVVKKLGGDETTSTPYLKLKKS